MLKSIVCAVVPYRSAFSRATPKSCNLGRSLEGGVVGDPLQWVEDHGYPASVNNA